MKCKCMDCGKKFRNQSALSMHARDKHPQLVRARAHALVARRKPWLSPFTRGFWAGIVVLASSIAVPVVAAVQVQAIQISPQGVVTLKAWETAVVPASVKGAAKK